jgi:hypothetical protein
METYKNINEFINKNFPGEMKNIAGQKKTDTEEIIERANAEFDEKLKAIIKGESVDGAASNTPKPD